MSQPGWRVAHRPEHRRLESRNVPGARTALRLNEGSLTPSARSTVASPGVQPQSWNNAPPSVANAEGLILQRDGRGALAVGGDARVGRHAPYLAMSKNRA